MILSEAILLQERAPPATWLLPPGFWARASSEPADQADEAALDVNLVGAENARLVVGVGGFQVHPKVALVGGYRWLSVNYDKDDFLFDNVIHGPVLGATFIIK